MVENGTGTDRGGFVLTLKTCQQKRTRMGQNDGFGLNVSVINRQKHVIS